MIQRSRPTMFDSFLDFFFHSNDQAEFIDTNDGSGGDDETEPNPNPEQNDGPGSDHARPRFRLPPRRRLRGGGGRGLSGADWGMQDNNTDGKLYDWVL